MKKLILAFLGVQFLSFGYTQQDPYLSLEGFSTLTYNPASFGQRNILTVNTFGRMYNDRIVDPPIAYGISSAYRFYNASKKENKLSGPLGVGINYFVDQYDFFTSQSVSLPISKGFSLNETYLSIGLAPGFHYLNFDEDGWISPQSSGDPSFPNSGSEWEFDLSAGLFWYGENFYLGFSSSHITNPVFDKLNYKLERNYHLNGGYQVKFNKFSVYPMATYSYVDGFQNLATRCYFQFFNELISVGPGYVVNSQIEGNLMLNYKGFNLGYSYALVTSPLTNAYGKAHELRLSFLLKE